MTLKSIRRVFCVALAVCALAMLSQASHGQSLPRQPYLGFDGYVVDLPAHLGLPRDVKGMTVRSVRWRSPAAPAGLERGDIVVTTIDGVAFHNNPGYMQALRMAWPTPVWAWPSWNKLKTSTITKPPPGRCRISRPPCGYRRMIRLSNRT